MRLRVKPFTSSAIISSNPKKDRSVQITRYRRSKLDETKSGYRFSVQVKDTFLMTNRRNGDDVITKDGWLAEVESQPKLKMISRLSVMPINDHRVLRVQRLAISRSSRRTMTT